MKHLILKKSQVFLLILSCSLIWKCTPQPKPITSEEIWKSLSSIDGYTIYADTIVYDIIIKNPNPEDRWANQCLKGLKRSALVDSIFEIAYSEHSVITDYFTNEPLRRGQLRELESRPERGRDAIGKIQFTERWLLNANKGVLRKDVLQIVLGYEIISSNTGEVRGYEPAFRIQLNTSND